MTRATYFEKLEQFIFDESRMVTYKIVSRELKVNVNEAKQYLQEFLEEHKSENLNATYFLSGIAKKEPGNPLKVYVVCKDNLEKTKESLSEVTSCHVYSVSKALLRDELTLVRLDLPHNRNHEEYSSYTVIKHPNVEIKTPILNKASNGVKKEVKPVIPRKEGTSFFKNVASNAVKKTDKTEPPENSGFNKAAEPVENKKSEIQSPVKKSHLESKSQKPNTLASMWQKSEEKSKKSADLKPEGKGKTKSPQETKQMPKNNILSMFSKQAGRKNESLSKKSAVSDSSKTPDECASSTEKLTLKSESPSKTEREKETKSTKASSNKKKINQRQTKASKHKKDDESDDELQPTKKKHRRICTFDDSDSESEESEEAQDRAQRNLLSTEEPMVVENSAKPAVAISDDEEPIPPTPPVASSKGKNKAYKTIQKTFEDEDGFFVTKQEKVLVSDEDEDPLPQPSKDKEVTKSNQFTYRKQASLTSFFKQK